MAVDNFTVYESYPTQEEDWFLSQPSILSSLSLSYRYQASSSDILQPGAAGDQCSLGEVLEQKDPFALYHTNRKLTLEPKVNKEEDKNSSSLHPQLLPSSPIVRQMRTTIVIGSTTELLYIRDDLHIDLFQSIIKYRYKQHNTELLE